MSRLNELRELTRIRVLSFLREPEAVFWVFVFPLVLAAVLGFAFRSSTVAPSVVGVIESPVTQKIIDVLDASQEIDLKRFDNAELAHNQLRKAAIDVLLAPGETGENAAEDNHPIIHADATRTEAAMAQLRIEQALRHAEQEQALDQPEDMFTVVPLTEAGSRYIDFLFPGLIGMNLMGTGMWGIGFAIADVRRRNFLKRLLVTPMRRSSFFLSFMLSRLVFLALELTVLTVFAILVLGVPFRCDVISYGLICILGALVFAGMGILIASRARTIEGVSGMMNGVMMPMWLASGVFFSYERFPEFLHPALQMLPLTALNDALRALMIDGESILSQGKEIAVMVGWSILSFAVALRIFRWE
ncbi:MAG: ABC transporter permease [Phycisphaerales bacterium]